jgi:hypothetical protein
MKVFMPISCLLAAALLPSSSAFIQPSLIATKPTLSSTSLLEQKQGSASFSLGNLFGGSASAATSTASALRGTGEPHPSVRQHISPLNRLHDKKPVKPITSEPLPVHPDVVSGVLSNGLSYIILPNRSPPGRFEAHLQVFSGSADELEPQQGIAHLTEHVAYMGSRKRERLFGTGSQVCDSISNRKISSALDVTRTESLRHILFDSLHRPTPTRTFSTLSFTRHAP